MEDKSNTFESAIKRLEEIVSVMEKGECSLDESMKLYEEGVQLSDFCGKQLTAAEQTVTTLAEKLMGATEVKDEAYGN